MTTQQPYQTWDDGVDLRAFIDTLFRRRWMILALVILAMGAVGVLNYLVLPPTYETSVVVTLPAAGITDRLGVTQSGYKEFASSNPVMAAVQQKLGTQLTPSELAGHYSVQLEQTSGLLTVTVSAEAADETLKLARLWVDAFYEQTLALLRAQLDRQKSSAEQAEESLLANVTKTEDVLATLDQKTSIPLEEARLSDLEKGLVNSESRLRDLTLFAISNDEARLAYLQSALGKEPQTLGNSQGVVVLEGGSGAGVTSKDVTILNPIYLQLSQDLADTRTRLTAERREAEILEEHLSSLQRDVDRLRGRVVQNKTERQRLDLRINEARAVYNPAREELDRLLDTERHLPELARPEVVSEPIRPEAPVAPRKVFNMAIAGVVAALAGVVIALLLEGDGGKGETEASRRRMAAPAPLPSDR